MDVDALRLAIAADRARGLVPFMLVSSAGTTNTGAVDPLARIADVADAAGLWHHCDGAYGAFFYLVDELQATLRGMERADSLALDPHKGLFLPYGTGALLVRDGEALRAAHQASAGYLPPLPEDDFFNPCQYGPELSRDFRGLRVWLPLKLYGVERFRRALTEKRELAVMCADALAGTEGITVVHRPELSLFSFVVSKRNGRAAQNEDTRALIDRVNAKGRVMITGAQVGEVFYGRVCVLCFRTRREHVEHGIEDIRAALNAQ